MVAGAAQRLAVSARSNPTRHGQNQKDLFVGAPGQGLGDLLRGGRGIASDRTRQRDIRLGRPDCDWKVWPAAKAAGSNSSAHGSNNRKRKYLFQRATCRPGPLVAPDEN